MAPDTDPSSKRIGRRRLAWVVAGLVALLAIAVPSALAIHDFTDVPDASPFHGDIAAVKGAGVTSGKTCDPPGVPPTYCPLENITREAMAAFVHRGFGRTAGNESPSNLSLDDAPYPAGPPVDLAVVTISVGGVAGQTQFVTLNGTVGALTSTPGEVAFWIAQDGVGLPLTVLSGFGLPTLGPSGTAFDSGATTVAVPVPTGTTQTFRLQAFDFSNTNGIVAWGELTAVTAPFGSTGASTLGTDAAPTKSGGLAGKK